MTLLDCLDVWRKGKTLRKENTAFQHKNLILSVKHGGASIMVWACFAASGPGQLAIIDGTINSELYQQILKDNIRTSVRTLALKRVWVSSNTMTLSKQVVVPKNG